MPWSPIPRFPDVVVNIRKRGYEKEVPVSAIKLALIEELKIVRPETISRTIALMEQLGFIEKIGNGIYLLKNK